MFPNLQLPTDQFHQSWLRKSAQSAKWIFCLTAASMIATKSGDVMTKRTRRNHAPAFKAKVALAALKDRTGPEEIHRNSRKSSKGLDCSVGVNISCQQCDERRRSAFEGEGIEKLPSPKQVPIHFAQARLRADLRPPGPYDRDLMLRQGQRLFA